MKTGFCYAVLSSNGTCKMGRSAAPIERIKDHMRVIRSFGMEVERIYLTEQVEDCHRLEAMMFYFLGRGEPNQNEYIPDVSQKDIRSMFDGLNVNYFQGSDIRRSDSDGEMLLVVRPYAVAKPAPSGNAIKKPLAVKIVSLLEKNQSATFGVLCNRLRKYSQEDIERECRELTESGVLVKNTYTHPANRMDVAEYEIAV